MADRMDGEIGKEAKKECYQRVHEERSFTGATVGGATMISFVIYVCADMCVLVCATVHAFVVPVTVLREARTTSALG